jgi:predicted glycosyltransferase involved in capsule biosynthesis
MSEKIDFSDISIISHIRVENAERIQNFHLRNSIYHGWCDNLEMIHVEDDKESKIEKYISAKDKHILTNNTGVYNKNTSYNTGFENTDRPYLLFLDVDCIVDPMIIKNIVSTVNVLNTGVVYPFKGCLYSNKKIKERIVKTPTLENILAISNAVPCKPHTHPFGRMFINSCGGAILVKRDIFKQVGGFKPPFRISTDSVMIHLHHGNHTYIRNDRAMSMSSARNKREYDKVMKMPKDKCIEYMKGWGIYEN